MTAVVSSGQSAWVLFDHDQTFPLTTWQLLLTC